MDKKGKAGKGVEKKELTEEQLQELLQTLNLNEVNQKRHCFVILGTETDESSAEVLDLCHFAYQNDQQNTVKFVNYENLVDFIRKGLNGEVSLNDPNLDSLIKTNCLKAMTYLDSNRIIPCDIIAALIKLFLIKLINDDVMGNKEVFFKALEKEYEKNALISSIGDDGAGKKKKGKDKKGDKKDKGKKGSKKGKGDAKQEDVCGAINKFEPLFGPLPKPEAIEVPFKEIYVVLFGYYDAMLIKQLIEINVPFACVLEISISDTTINFDSQPYCVSSVEIIDDSLASSSILGTSEVTKSSSDFIPEATKTEILQAFWVKINELFEGPLQHEYLQDCFHMKFISPIEHFEVLGSEKYVEQSEECFKKLTAFVTEIPEIRRRYVNYIRNIKLQNLGDKPRMVTIKNFKTYKKLLDRFPPECINVAVLMQGIVDEVSKRVPHVESSFDEEPSSIDFCACSKESLFLEAEEETTHSDHDEMEVHHGNVREQLIGIFKRYKKRNKINIPGVNMIKCRSKRYQPRINTRLSSNPFIVHEKNFLEIMANSYKGLSDEIFSINLRALQKIRSVLIWNECTHIPEIIKMMNKYHLENWQNNLGITPKELRDALNLFLFNSIACVEKCEGIKSTSSLQGIFPKKPKEQKLQEAKPSLFKSAEPAESDSLLKTLMTSPQHNVYETLNLSEYSWKEILNPPALLQELENAQNDYVCMDYKYCKIVDSILVRFHNNADDFGVSTQIWDQPLRTPLCIRDFCKYITHEDTDWLENQDALYKFELEQELRRCRESDNLLRQSAYPDLVVKEDDFILPGSLKDQALKEDDKKDDAKKGKSDKKSDKSKMGKSDKKSDKSKKGKSDKKSDKSKGKKDSGMAELTPAQISVLQQLTKDTVPERPKLPSLHCAEVGSPFAFIGYDLAQSRLQLTGSTTTFLSLDGTRITVDKTSWLGGPPNLSIDVTANNHKLIFHHNEKTREETFMFHIYHASNTVVAMAKPHKLLNTEVAICQKICHALKDTKKTPTNGVFEAKRQELYFVSEKQHCVLRSFRIPFISKRSIILSETLLVPFLQSLERLDIRAQVKTSIEPPIQERSKRKHNLDVRYKLKVNSRRQISIEDVVSRIRKTKNPHFGLPKIITKQLSISRASRSCLEEELSLNFLREGVISKKDTQTFNENPTLVPTRAEFLQKLKQALMNHIPCYKICSSRLHKYNYVKRCKSYINIPIGAVMKRVLCKPVYCRTKRNIEVTKCFPIGISANGEVIQSCYDLRVSLPSGLIVRNVPGILPHNFHVKQYYIDKGPQCKNILNEDSRTFMRNGNIMIKHCDGNVTVYSLNGNILHFEVPYIKKSRVFKPEYKQRIPKEARKYFHHETCSRKSIPIHACSESLTQFQKVLHRIVRRFQKHSIDGKESRYCRSRISYLRRQKKYMTDPDKYFLLQTGKVPFPKYSLVRSDGTKITVTDTNIYNEQKYYTSIDKDYRYEQTYFEREDGMHWLLDREGILSTEYPDGTRICTWYCIEPEPIFIREAPLFNENSKYSQYDYDFEIVDEDEWFLPKYYDFGEEEEEPSADGSKSSSNESVEDEGWVSIHIFYQYEHPNYATVIFGGPGDEMKLFLPNHLEISNTKDDIYEISLDKNVKVTIDKDIVEHFCSLCDCNRGCKSQFHITHLYRNETFNKKSDLLRVSDSYRKIFAVTYEGACRRNVEFVSGSINESLCKKHCKITTQKLFVIKKDLSGVMFWNDKMYKDKCEEANEDENSVINVYGDEQDNNKAVEFRTYVYKPFYKVYTMPPIPTKLMLPKYRIRTEMSTLPLCYIQQRTVNQIPPTSKLVPFYQEVMKCCEEAQLDVNSYQNNFYGFVESIHEKRKREILEWEASQMVESTTTEEFIPTITMYDKWYAWQEECKRLKSLIREQYVPPYFQSAYGRKYRDSYVSGQTPESEMGDYDLPHLQQEWQEQTPSSRTMTIEKDTHRTVKVKKTHSGGYIKTVTEKIDMKLPKDIVILAKGSEPVEIVDETDDYVAKTDDFRLLIMTNVRERSKMDIARNFECKEKVCETCGVCLKKDDLVSMPRLNCTKCRLCMGLDKGSDVSCSICDTCIDQKVVVRHIDQNVITKTSVDSGTQKGLGSNTQKLGEADSRLSDAEFTCTVCRKCFEGGEDDTCTICDKCLEATPKMGGTMDAVEATTEVEYTCTICGRCNDGTISPSCSICDACLTQKRPPEEGPRQKGSTIISTFTASNGDDQNSTRRPTNESFKMNVSEPGSDKHAPSPITSNRTSTSKNGDNNKPPTSMMDQIVTTCNVCGKCIDGSTDLTCNVCEKCMKKEPEINYEYFCRICQKCTGEETVEMDSCSICDKCISKPVKLSPSEVSSLKPDDLGDKPKPKPCVCLGKTKKPEETHVEETTPEYSGGLSFQTNITESTLEGPVSYGESSKKTSTEEVLISKGSNTKLGETQQDPNTNTLKDSKNEVPEVSLKPLDLVYPSKNRLGTIPIYEELTNTLKYASIQQIPCQTYNVTYTSSPFISDNVRSTVSKVMSLLFKLGPYLPQSELDAIVHPILHRSEMTHDDIEALCHAVHDEILNGDWLDNYTDLADASFEVIHKNSTTETRTAPDTIIMLVKMIKKHLKRQFLKSNPKGLHESVSDFVLKKDENKVTFYLGNVMKVLIDKLKFHVGTLTWEKRLGIINTALQAITDAALRPEEILQFLQNLDSAAHVQIKTLPRRKHVSGDDDKIEVCESKDDITKKIIGPIIASIERYKKILSDINLSKLKTLSDILAKKPSTEFNDMSKLISLTKVTKVLKHYGEDNKGKPVIVQVAQKGKKHTSTISFGAAKLDQDEEDTLHSAPSKSKVSFSKEVHEQCRESSVTILHISNVLNKQQVETGEVCVEKSDSKASSRVTILGIPKKVHRTSIRPSMRPIFGDAVEHCMMCQSNDVAEDVDQLKLYRSISEYYKRTTNNDDKTKEQECEGDTILDNVSDKIEVPSPPSVSSEKTQQQDVSKSSTEDVTSYDTEDPLIIDEDLDVPHEKTPLNRVGEMTNSEVSSLFMNFKEDSRDLKVKKPFICRKPRKKILSQKFVDMVKTCGKKTNDNTNRGHTGHDQMTLIHESKYNPEYSTTMMDTYGTVEACSNCVKSLISSHVSLCDFHKSRSVQRTSSMRPLRSRMSFDQSIKSLQLLRKLENPIITPSMTPLHASSLFYRHLDKIPSNESIFSGDTSGSSSEKVQAFKEIVYDVGVQTQKGKDEIVQTPNRMLPHDPNY